MTGPSSPWPTAPHRRPAPSAGGPDRYRVPGPWPEVTREKTAPRAARDTARPGAAPGPGGGGEVSVLVADVRGAALGGLPDGRVAVVVEVRGAVDGVVQLLGDAHGRVGRAVHRHVRGGQGGAAEVEVRRPGGREDGGREPTFEVHTAGAVRVNDQSLAGAGEVAEPEVARAVRGNADVFPGAFELHGGGAV